MLRNEASPQHLQPLPRHLFHNRRVVEEPPAAERHQVRELPRVDAQLMLVLPAQHADQEPVPRILPRQVFHRPQIRLTQRIARQLQRRVHQIPHANHQRERNPELAARRQHRFRQHPAAHRILRELERVRQRDRQEPAHFDSRFTGCLRVHLVALRRQHLPVLRPLVQDAVQPQHRVKHRVRLRPFQPLGRFRRIQRIVRHHRFAHARQLEDIADVRRQFLRREERAGLPQILALGRQPERLQHRDHAARCFR